MKKIVILSSIMIISMTINSCQISSSPNPKHHNVLRFGPVLLKIDNEWIISQDKIKYIRIGIVKYALTEYEPKYKSFSLKLLSLNSSTISLTKKGDSSINSLKISYFDIPMNSNEVWLDLFTELLITYDVVDNRVHTLVMNNASFFVYHPLKKEWWGVYPDHAMNIVYFNEDIYEKEYDSVNDFKEFLTNWSEKSKLNPSYDINIIEKRTLKIPSTKVLDDKMSKVLENYGLFCWYVEKEEPEKVGPKDDD